MNPRQDIERQVAGAFVHHAGEAFDELGAHLNLAEISSTRCRTIIDSALRLFLRDGGNQPVNVPSVLADLEARGELDLAGGTPFITSLPNGSWTGGRLPFLYDQLRDLPAPGEADLPDLGEDRNRTDVGAARAFATLHGRDLRHVHGRGWLAYNSRSWTDDRTGEVMVRAKATGEAMLRAAVEISDKKVREDAIAFALKSMSEPRLKAMVVLAASEPGIPILADKLDADPWLLNVENGTIDLRTGDLREHRRADLITRMVACAYVKAATCPEFMKFLHRIMDGREDMIGFLRRAIGYALSGSTQEQVIFFFYGGGANGKSTFLNVLLHLLGDYGRQAPSDVLLAKRNDAHPTGVAGLAGARLVSVIEVDEGRRLAEGLVKQLSGGDKVAARFVKKDFFEYAPQFKIFLAANHKPVIRGTDLAIWRRIRLVPFDVSIPPDEQDQQLPDKLRTELPGILAWAIDGCLEWQRVGLAPPAAVLAATDTYRAESDTLGAFIADRCCTGPDEWVPKAEIYTAFKEWAEESGEHVISKKAFGARLVDRGGIKDGREGSTRFWTGIGLLRTERNDT
jgi:putative DNA primase/helicase